MLSFQKNENRAANPSSSTSAFSEFDVLIGRNTVLEGNLKSGGSIRIDGHVTGEIRADGEIHIGSEARCIGNVYSQNIEIAGYVDGDVHTNGHLKIYSTGCLKGNIEVASFVIDTGGILEGLCQINTLKTGTQNATDTEIKNIK